MKKRIIVLVCIIIALLAVVFVNSKVSVYSENINAKQSSNKSSIETNNDNNGLVIYADDLYSDTIDEAKIEQNTTNLQKHIDNVSNAGGGIVHIPAGTYYFASGGVNERKVEEYVIKCKNNVTIEGEGRDETNINKCTILKPYGKVTQTNNGVGGIDMFYFNDYRDYNTDTYLENMNFKDFIIDSEQAEGGTYNTSGKGFMINLMKDCNWENITVKNTDGTGFGMDCPINCTIKDCLATDCGKTATSNDVGASGFGIGTGYSNEESINISNCISLRNTKFGFFFEHQGRFGGIKSYPAERAQGFVVSNCIASDNLYDFGGARANDVTYENCSNDYPYESEQEITNKEALYFENMSRRIHIVNCKSKQKFTDVDSSEYYYEPVYWALNNAIASGTSTTEFSPNEKCTRAQAITFLYRIAERPGEVVYSSGDTLYNNFEGLYKDVSSRAYYADAVKWAKGMKIIDDTSENFLPDNSCTRADFITFLWKYAGSPIVTTKHQFTDIPSGEYYEKAVNWAVERNILTVEEQNKFLPEASCTRAEVVTFLYCFSNSNNSFNITYNYNINKALDNEPVNPTSYEAGKSNFTLINPTKTGYTFNGWTGSNYNQYVDSQSYSPSQEVQITVSDTGNKEYTANYTPIQYIVSFDSNGGIGEMQNELFVYDLPQVLSPNEFTKEGYDFAGWNTKSDGSGQTYKNAQAIKNLTSDSGKVITLYAQWITSSTENRNNIFIGDSMFVEMRNIIGNTDIYSAKRGSGIDWIKSTGVPNIESQIDKNTNIIIRTCANDLFNIYLNNGEVDVDRVVEEYRKYFNAKAIQWIQNGARVYFVSAGPFDDKKIDETTRKVNTEDCIRFNTEIQSVLKGITYIDVYSNIIEEFSKTDLTRDDGSHGIALLYSKEYKIIKTALGQSYTPTYDALKNMVDVPNNASYYFPAKWGYENVYIDPESETTFSPNSICTRADALTLLWRSCGIPKDVWDFGTDKCEDVSESDLYYDAVLWGYDREIAFGEIGNKFLPNEKCNRATFITFLWRMAGNPTSSRQNNFSDVQDEETYYYNAINWAVSEGIIKEDNDTFLPKDGCTRSDAITFLYRYYNKEDIVEQVAYKVEHYKETLESGKYELADTDQNLKATSWESVTPKTKSYVGFTAPSMQTVTVKADGSTVIKYYYTRNSYTVTLTAGSGTTQEIEGAEYKFGALVTLEASIKQGYENITWTTIPEITDKKITTSGTQSSCEFTMLARNVSVETTATPIEYIIEYNLDGGTVTGNPTTYNVESEDITLKMPTKTGYIFTGWTGNGITTPTKTVTITKGTTGKQTYMAHWEIDESNKLEVTVNYSETKPTNQNVIVTLTSNTKMEAIKGWILSADKMNMTKEYEKNITENIEILNEYGSKAEVEVKINNIDRIAPEIENKYEYSADKKKVTVTITSNEELLEIEGWHTEDNITFIKTYEKNGEESLVLKDLAGNEIENTITIDQIEEDNEDPTTPSNPDDNEKPTTPSNPDDNEKPTTPSNPENNEKPNDNGGKDNTITNKEIPNAGLKTAFTLVSIVIFAICIVSFKKYKQYKDI